MNYLNLSQNKVLKFGRVYMYGCLLFSPSPEVVLSSAPYEHGA